MMMATCRGSFRSRVLCIVKLLLKKISGGGQPLAMRPAWFALHRRCGVAHDLLEHVEIVEVARAPFAGDPTHRLRSIAVETLDDLDQAGVVQHLQMPGEIAVGQAAQVLEVAEQQTLGVGGERRENAQAGFLMDHAIEALVGEASAIAAGFRALHRRPRNYATTETPRGTGRRRTASPWPMAIMIVHPWRPPGTRVP